MTNNVISLDLEDLMQTILYPPFGTILYYASNYEDSEISYSKVFYYSSNEDDEIPCIMDDLFISFDDVVDV